MPHTITRMEQQHLLVKRQFPSWQTMFPIGLPRATFAPQPPVSEAQRIQGTLILLIIYAVTSITSSDGG